METPNLTPVLNSEKPKYVSPSIEEYTIEPTVICASPYVDEPSTVNDVNWI